MVVIKKLLIFGLAIIYSSGCILIGDREAKEAIYILPKGFSGPVIILLNQPNGEQPSTESGFQVYRVPTSGILRTSKDATYKIDRLSFFYEVGEGNRIELEYVSAESEGNISGRSRKTFKDISEFDETIYVMGAEMGSFNSEKGVVRFRAFQVGRVIDSEKIQSELRSQIVSLQKSL